MIEVADSTLAYDRGAKLARYAAAGIPEVWIVNLRAQEGDVLRRAIRRGVRQHPHLWGGREHQPSRLSRRGAGGI